jgi:hypothetical protein
MNSMNRDDDQLNASELTGADAMFSDVVEALTRGYASASPVVSAGASPGKESAKARRVRQRLLEFQVEFRRAYADLLQKHLGEDGAAAALTALRAPALRRYVAARRAMTPELSAGLSGLVRRMGATEL